MQGMSWMMMGSAGEGLKAPEKRPIFVEDLGDSELAKIVSLCLHFVSIMRLWDNQMPDRVPKNPLQASDRLSA